MAIDYKSAGVDVEAGYKAVTLMKQHVQKTYNNSVLGELGSFGGFYALDDKPDGDCLVAGTDGVGTKLKYAFILDKHDTIGIDAVAMCVNDIICQGAKPLFFLDYIASGKIIPTRIEQIVKGVSDGCVESGCAIIGGETAEMPGFYTDGDYDIAGFAVGIVKKNKIINGKNIKSGNTVIGLRASGVHSNGYSLVRKLFGEDLAELNTYNETLGCTPAEVVLTPTKLYVKPILAIIEKFDIKGIAHITGGGFIENIPRMMPKGLAVKFNKADYAVPNLFKALQEIAEISDEKMYNTFNMGTGMVLAVESDIAEAVIAELKTLGQESYILGEVVEGDGLIIV